MIWQTSENDILDWRSSLTSSLLMLLEQNAIRQKKKLKIILKLKACSIGPNFKKMFLKILCTVGFPLFMSNSAVAKEEEGEEDLGR